MSTPVWTDFEHQIWKSIKKYDLQNCDHWVVAVSGGVDSVVLAQCLLNIFPQKKISFLHYHHGRKNPGLENENVNENESSHQQQTLFRDQCLAFLQNWVEELKQQKREVNLHFEMSSVYLEGELECRQARHGFFQKQVALFKSSTSSCTSEVKPQDYVFCTAHQNEDLLETRLIKLLRGTSVESLQSFQEWNGQIYRPLLSLKKKNIIEFAKHNSLKWVEDPTNKESVYLRNWLRNEWLPQLEKFHPGSVHQFSLSLDRLLQSHNNLDKANFGLINEADQNLSSPQKMDVRARVKLNEISSVSEGKKSVKKQMIILKIDYYSLTEAEKIQVIAHAFRHLPEGKVSLGQIKELIKRLDKNQKELIFFLTDYKCFTNAEQIMLELK